MLEWANAKRGCGMSLKMLAVYFVVGGLIVSGITYLGSLGKSQWAAFLAFLPSISVITLISIYFSGGTASSVAYAKNMLILLPSWVLYVMAVIFLLPRIGLAASLAASVALYMGTAYLVIRLT